MFCAITSWYRRIAGACLALPEEEYTSLLAPYCVRARVHVRVVCVCVCGCRSAGRLVTSLHHDLMAPLPSSLQSWKKGVIVLIAAFPPSASLCLINIHSIDLFSELTKKKLTVCQEINPDRSVALLFHLKTAGSRNMHMQIHRARHQLNVD